MIYSNNFKDTTPFKTSVPNFLERHQDRKKVAGLCVQTQELVHKNITNDMMLKKQDSLDIISNQLKDSKHGDLAPLGDLIRRTKDVNAQYQSNTVLAMASFHGNLASVTSLLSHPDTRVNQANEYGNTALIWAAQGNYLGIVRKLLADTRFDILAHGQGKKALAKTRDVTIRELIEKELSEKGKSQSFFARFFKS